MSEKRVTVWVQAFKDRPALMLQWIDPDTGRRRSQSAGTKDPVEAEQKRSDKVYELNHGLHVEPSKMTWERFREIYTDVKASSGADSSALKASSRRIGHRRRPDVRTEGFEHLPQDNRHKGDGEGQRENRLLHAPRPSPQLRQPVDD